MVRDWKAQLHAVACMATVLVAPAMVRGLIKPTDRSHFADPVIA
jgi:hypothetical protein